MADHNGAGDQDVTLNHFGTVEPDGTGTPAEDGMPTRDATSTREGTPARNATRAHEGTPAREDAAAQDGTTAQEATSDQDVSADRPGHRSRGIRGALALTFVATFIWGIAHLAVRRRLAGGLLLGAFTLLLAAGTTAVVGHRRNLIRVAVRPDWLTGAAIAMLALGLLWVLVVIRSYQVTRPVGARRLPRYAGRTAVGILCVLVATPFVWAAHATYLYRDTLSSVFQPAAGGEPPSVIDTDNPWGGRARVNILLLGGDAAADRTGVRTDSVTLASIDTTTGRTVLLSLPRNLEHVPMPAGPARARFPNGFTGDGPLNPGLLNEVFEYAENHPEVVPGAAKGHRGPELVKRTVSEILGQPVDYYVLVDMFGFADIVDAMGGVKIKIDRPIPYGQRGGVLQPGYRTLGGKDALWYGRSRNDSDDYARMSRQKCLLRAIAEQADPQRVLTRFERLAAATKRAISTDIPQALLPALIDLSGKVKNGGQIYSLQFVPPLIHSGDPDFALIRELSAKAITDSEHRPSPSATQDGTPAPPQQTSAPATIGSPTPGPGLADPMSLDATCPA
jgi:LCP family protein required for cell wall assembly